MQTQQEDPVIRTLINFGEKHEQIRAMILFSSRTNPNASCDVFSDYDVEIYATDPSPFAKDDAWFEEFGSY